MLNNLLLGQTGEEKLYVEDVFSNIVYTGTAAGQTINSGIDLAGKGGLIWEKARNFTDNHYFVDTARGGTKYVMSNSAAANNAGTTTLYNFLSNGYSTTNAWAWGSSTNVASWTFRKAPKFFDCITWTGDGTSNKTVDHSLGSVPGFVIIKVTSTTGNWRVAARKSDNDYVTAYLNLTNAGSTVSAATMANAVNATTLNVGYWNANIESGVNTNGQSFVAYLFAHDTTADGIVQCGSFTTDGSGNATVSLGWEPQYVLIKSTSTTGGWYILDTMRGWGHGTDAGGLMAQSTGADNSNFDLGFPNATGFNILNSIGASTSFIYLAIRRGPMRTPTDATKVFAPVLGSTYNSSTISGSINTSFTVDASILGYRTGGDTNYQIVTSRLTTPNFLGTSNTASETNWSGVTKYDRQTGWGMYTLDSTWVGWNFRRAPGFFDVVCYTGTGSARTVSHNLGVAPELMIVKSRGSSGNWYVYSQPTGNNKTLYLDLTSVGDTAAGFWNNTTPTVASFSLGSSSGVNANGGTYVAYLFASCPGVSKVFSFTGNGSSQNIDCGFTNGARFVLIKRTDSTGNWMVADTARGLVSGNDPSLALNSTAAEVTSLDWLDPYSAGFTVNQESTNNANVNGATYIGIAIA